MLFLWGSCNVVQIEVFFQSRMDALDQFGGAHRGHLPAVPPDRLSFPDASLIGATSLIFNAKGNPVGLVLGLAFCLLYGYISYTFAYYGEMLTYLA